MKYYIILPHTDSRVTFDDENPATEDICVTLVDGEIISDEDDNEFDDERLDVTAVDEAMGEMVARHDLSDPTQRECLRMVLTRTKETAEAKIADHTSMLTLAEKYLSVIPAPDKKRKLRSVR
jgi:hypothetical protein